MKNTYRNKTIKRHSGKIDKIKGCVLHKSFDITAIYSALHYQYTPTFQFDGEVHDFWELVYLNSGSATVEESEKSYILKPSQFIIHSPNTFHRIYANNVKCDVIIISFDSSASYLNQFSGGDKRRVYVANNIQKVLILEILDLSRGLLENLKSGVRDVVAEQSVKNMMELFFLYVNYYGIYNKTAKKITKYSNRLVQTIVEYLEKNISNKVAFNDLRQFTNYSESYLGKLFKKHTGLSIFQYYNKLKLQKAMEMLSQKDYTITEISEYLGFDTIQYFTYFIKKNLKMSPTEYRNSAIKINLVNPNENDILLLNK